MRKFILLCLLMFTVSSVVFAQQMTDEQVILYVQEAQSQGKTQQQMLVELMKKRSRKSKSSEYSLNIQVNRTVAPEMMLTSWERQVPACVRRKLTKIKIRISPRMSPVWMSSTLKNKALRVCGQKPASRAAVTEWG